MNDEYYVVIDGVQYDRKMIECADRAVKGRGDGRISIEDAMALLGFVKDESVYTDVEKATMHYIRDNYPFTQAADHAKSGSGRRPSGAAHPGFAGLARGSGLMFFGADRSRRNGPPAEIGCQARRSGSFLLTIRGTWAIRDSI